MRGVLGVRIRTIPLSSTNANHETYCLAKLANESTGTLVYFLDEVRPWGVEPFNVAVYLYVQIQIYESLGRAVLCSRINLEGHVFYRFTESIMVKAVEIPLIEYVAVLRYKMLPMG